MNQLDWVGSEAMPREAKAIGNTRPSVAEEKAELALQLGKLINHIPASVNRGGVEYLRTWRNERAAAAKIAASKTASVHQLRCAISAMERFE